MHFSGDTLAHVYAGLAAETRAELEVVGDGGALFPAEPWRCREPGIEIRRPDGFERVEIPLVDSYRLQVENMSAAIRGVALLLLSRSDAVGQARTLGALHRAAETGRGRARQLAAHSGRQQDRRHGVARGARTPRSCNAG